MAELGVLQTQVYVYRLGHCYKRIIKELEPART